MNISRRAFLAGSSLSTLSGVLLLSIVPAQASETKPAPLATTLADWSSLAARRKADPDLDRLVVALLERAQKDLDQSPLERKLIGKRLLNVSREFIRRTLQWAFAYKVTGTALFLDRARQEMLNVSRFSDWHPDHYLDVAEMTAGMALGYSWLGDDLAAPDRSVIAKAIIDKGIGQARHGHKTFQATNNWNQVCIGGMSLGALAVAKDQPELSRDLLRTAKDNIHFGLKAYEPDGVYPEGPGYWDYGTTYSILLVAALRSAGTLGDWGILDAPGVRRSGEFFAQAIGPSGKTFNFADGNEGPGFTSALVYLARDTGQTAWLTAMRHMIESKKGLADRFAPLAALWWPTETSGSQAATGFFGQGEQPVAIWRSSWQDPNALWLAIKGGGAAHNHAHMDAGSFVLDMDGVRWAKDLGMQDYNSLESKGIDLWNMKQSSPRWQVFRLSAAAHNTVTLNGQPHNATGMASLQKVNDTEAAIDLTPALLPGQVRRATRMVRFDTDMALISDEILGAHPDTVIRWAMNTEAEIAINGKQAVLSQSGKHLVIRFDGDDLALSILDISEPRHDYDLPNPGVRQLVVTGKPKSDGRWTLSARFSRS